jgi:hypothetical protein
VYGVDRGVGEYIIYTSERRSMRRKGGRRRG